MILNNYCIYYFSFKSFSILPHLYQNIIFSALIIIIYWFNFFSYVFIMSYCYFLTNNFCLSFYSIYFIVQIYSLRYLIAKDSICYYFIYLAYIHFRFLYCFVIISYIFLITNFFWIEDFVSNEEINTDAYSNQIKSSSL